MTRRTSAVCYVVAGICFAVSGAAGFAAGKTGFAVIRVLLGAAMFFLANVNIRLYRQEKADQALKEAGIDPAEANAQVKDAPAVDLEEKKE